MKYIATSSKQYNDQAEHSPVTIQAGSIDEAREKVINALDCSYAWTVAKLEETKLIAAAPVYKRGIRQ